MKFLKRNIFFFASSLLFALIMTNNYQSNAQSRAKVQVTSWKIVDSSLSKLLNDGWKLVNVSFADAATAPVPGVPGLRDQTFVYVLSNNGKYITCILSNPDTRSDNYSGCRLMN